MQAKQPFYLLRDEDLKRIDRMLSLIHLFVTELIDSRKLSRGTKEDSAFDEFEAYLERIATEAAQLKEESTEF